MAVGQLPECGHQKMRPVLVHATDRYGHSSEGLSGTHWKFVSPDFDSDHGSDGLRSFGNFRKISGRGQPEAISCNHVVLAQHVRPFPSRFAADVDDLGVWQTEQSAHLVF
jgi:hypothetical protein